MRNVSEKNVKKIKTRILCSITFFFDNGVLYEMCGKKNCRAGQATDDNTAYAHCMLDALGYKHTIRIRNTWVLISPEPNQEGNKLGSMSGTLAISTKSRRELSSRFFFCKARRRMKFTSF